MGLKFNSVRKIDDIIEGYLNASYVSQDENFVIVIKLSKLFLPPFPQKISKKV